MSTISFSPLCSLVLLLGTVWLLVEVTRIIRMMPCPRSVHPESGGSSTSTRNLAAPVLSLAYRPAQADPLAVGHGFAGPTYAASNPFEVCCEVSAITRPLAALARLSLLTFRGPTP